MVNTVLVWIKSSQVVWKKKTDSLTTSPLLQCLHRFTKRKWPSPPVRIPVGAARLWRAPPMASQLPTSAGSGGPGVPVFSAGSKKKNGKKTFPTSPVSFFLTCSQCRVWIKWSKRLKSQIQLVENVTIWGGEWWKQSVRNYKVRRRTQRGDGRTKGAKIKKEEENIEKPSKGQSCSSRPDRRPRFSAHLHSFRLSSLLSFFEADICRDILVRTLHWVFCELLLWNLRN